MSVFIKLHDDKTCTSTLLYLSISFNSCILSQVPLYVQEICLTTVCHHAVCVYHCKRHGHAYNHDNTKYLTLFFEGSLLTSIGEALEGLHNNDTGHPKIFEIMRRISNHSSSTNKLDNDTNNSNKVREGS